MLQPVSPIALASHQWNILLRSNPSESHNRLTLPIFAREIARSPSINSTLTQKLNLRACERYVRAFRQGERTSVSIARRNERQTGPREAPAWTNSNYGGRGRCR